MSDIKSTPVPEAPWPPLATNDALFRYPKPYPLTRGGKEDFAGIAKAHALQADNLITYNFRTSKLKEINFYLAKFIGCTADSPGRLSYTFEGVVYDAKKIAACCSFQHLATAPRIT